MAGIAFNTKITSEVLPHRMFSTKREDPPSE